MKLRFVHLPFIAIILLISSCTLEQKIARNYMNQIPKASVLIFAPEYVYTVNLKEYDSLENESMADYQIDSIRYYNSDVLQYLSDSIFLTKYISSYIEGLKNLGYEVYTSDYIDLFMEDTMASYVINIAQIELEEFTYEFRDQEYLDGQLYYANHELNAINFNSWFELNSINNNTDKKEVLYTSDFISDDLYSSYRQYIFTSEVKYEYSIDTLTTADVYNLVSLLGETYAEYTNDYFMNQYVIDNAPENESSFIYLHYNPVNKTFLPAQDDKFIILE